jgi:DNA topoisomerase-1
MAKNLVIVESPAKAKTIEGFLGKDFQVRSSFGHVRDLSKKGLGVDIENEFLPNYEISSDKKKIVNELKKAALEAETIWLASDEDREGEAISWHLVQALGLEHEKTKRIVFHEITKTAITKAIENPRGIDENLVDAQQARRVLDRLVGFELSPLLWKKVKPSLSAGRVQSVAVRLIVERENSIKEFKAESSYRVTAEFTIKGEKGSNIIIAELSKKFKDKDKAREFLTSCIDADFSIEAIDIKPSKKSPPPPFTTSTLQQEASRKLGFPVSKTMRVAQQLYENGKITYMRTDSVNLSNLAINSAKAEIIENFGKEYVKTRKYTTKTKGAQEAHEAIRPTYMNQKSVDGDDSQQKLYELIWRRAVASQMSEAILEKTNVTINISNSREKFLAKGEVIKFDGFLKLYKESTDEDNNELQKGALPPMKQGQDLELITMDATEKFTQPPSRYTEASLVKKMEELGIGRPSTYAPTISTIQKREYVSKEEIQGITRNISIISLQNGTIKEDSRTEKSGFSKNKLIPTDIGTLVNNFLIQYFDNILDYNFTAEVEKEFDEIAQGKKIWNDMIKEFYGPFHNRIEVTLENSEKVSGEKLLGKDPESGKNVYAKIGKYGPMAQIGDSNNGDVNTEKPKFAGLKKGQSIESITLEEALELFKFPRNLGEYEGESLEVSIGRFGPYVKHNSAFYSLTKEDDPMTVTKDRAIEIIKNKKQKEKENTIKEFDENPDVKILNGRYGPYISFQKKNYRIPKNKDPKSLALKDCLEIIEKSGKSKHGSGTKRAKKKS